MEKTAILRYNKKKPTQILLESQHLSFGTIARRTAFPFFLFSLVLCLLLALSWILLVPGLTRVDISGTVRNFSGLQQYKSGLDAQILALEQQRNAFLQPANGGLYEQLKALKADRVRFQQLRAAINTAKTSVFPSRSDVVFINHFTFDSDKGIAEIQGDVRNVGSRSMTVLAAFTEAVKQIPIVQHVQTSRFTRLEHADHTFYSPFTISLTLR